MAILPILDLQRNYVDCGIQTDLGPLDSLEACLHQRPERTGKMLNPGVEKGVYASQYIEDVSDSAVSHDFMVTESSEVAYIHSISSDSCDASPSDVRQGSRRKQRHAKLGRTRGKPSDAHKRMGARVVSMPETAPTCSIKMLESTSFRIVSMSERPKPDMLAQEGSSDAFEASASTENSYLTADEVPHCTRHMCGQVNDTPRTPSPPSSPESVMIIENSINLPQSFLRRHPKFKTQATCGDSDEGWVTWANSPPKPIPALHGPLSLPYARCPSGAEGTIIEGPDDLPRMIWGLGNDDVQPSYSRVTSNHAPHATPRRSAANPANSNVSPRFSRTPKHSSQGHPGHTRSRNAEAVPNDHHQVPQTAVHQRILERQGARYAVDQQLNRPGHAGMTQAGNSAKSVLKRNVIHTMHDLWTGEPFEADWHVLDMERGLGLDWQPTFTLRDSQVSGARVGNEQFPDYLTASTPVFMPGDITTGFQYPRIFVEPRPDELARASQRSSALEIAHKYQQQQQPQNKLPTPPRSSSTQWSPYFTSYQDTSNSPGLLASLPSRVSTIQNQHYPTGSLSQPLRRFVHERMANIDLGCGNINAPLQVDSSTSPRSSVQCSPDISVSLARFLQHRSTVVSPSVMSPPHPGPPPNTPLPPVPKYKCSSTSALLVTPPSPTSPETRTRTFSYQQPRSIPLARLIQRRLSSVPEEELSGFRSHSRLSSSPPSKQDKGFSRLQTPSDWQPPRVSNVRPVRTPSPLTVKLTPQTKTPDKTATQKTAGTSAKVKLPNPSRINDPAGLSEVNGQRQVIGHQKKKSKGKRVKQSNLAQVHYE